MSTQPAPLPTIETRFMDSKHTGRQYRITISLPYGYSKPYVEGWPFEDVSEPWPVVYLLDANWFFGIVADVVHSMAWCGGTSDAIVVGIGYPDQDSAQATWLSVIGRRNMDFTPVRDEKREKRIGEWAKQSIETGNANRFHQFIRDELIPAVERDFHADPSRRVLAGHSLGGNFASFALFEAPDLFNAFLIGSCNISDDDQYIQKREAAYAEEHNKLAAKVYLWAGEDEEDAENTTLTNTLRFAALLASRNYAGLSLVKQTFAGLNHCEVVAPGLQAGLKFALKK